ncbi:MAG: serine hydrolase domain-containing protein [Gemmataceae bacterium]
MRFLLLLVSLLIPSVALAQNLSVSGTAEPKLAAFDRLIANFVKQNGVPGATLAVAKNGRLVYSRGFGYSDLEAKTPVGPHDLFRIASVSKPLTAAAVLQLAERGKLDLDDKAFDILKLDPVLEPATRPDPRVRQITVRHLLQHTGGWDSERSIDPMFRSGDAARATGTPAPATAEAIIRYMLGRPLDFDPGTRYVYSNFGYCVLGRIIEHVAGMPYEDYVRKEVLAPLDINDMRLGRSRFSDRAKSEVRYYDLKNQLVQSVFPNGGEVPWAYGGWHLEAMDSHGGWIASAQDLVRFAAAFEAPAKCRILNAKSIATMFARPTYLERGTPAEFWYGCGWDVRPVGRAGKFTYWHSGKMVGSAALLVRRYDGVCWAVLCNADANATGESLLDKIDPALHEAADHIKQWPAGNQFK